LLFVGFDGAVSQESAEIAAAWCDFLLQHAKRVYGLGLAATGEKTNVTESIALAS
jgi:hypothetical protein